MKKSFILNVIVLFLIGLSTTYAQINVGGLPKSFSEKGINSNVSFKKMPFVDIQKLKTEDEIEDIKKDKPWRFGQNIDVDINIKESGKLNIFEDGSRIWRYGIVSEGALTINLKFGKYKLPDGALLYIYSDDKNNIIGAFNDFNNQDDGVFATTLINGDKIVIEYFEPANPKFSGELILNTVTHGYRGVGDHIKSFGSSGSCNMNVICPDGIPWEDDIRSTVMLVSGSNGFCTGALVNNTSEDGTPYLLTADHCYSDPSSWVFWFNWQSETCDNPGSSPAHNDMSGATLKAKNADSDFCLVLLNNTPPDEYLVYYAGWDNSDSQSNTQVGIHHPKGDIKKISFDDDPAISSDYLGSGIPDSHWQVNSWDRNTTTEPGSSGSPLFDQDHRIIGQLHGGYASCSSFTEDVYGKFSMSWDRGGNSSNQLKDWLDPTNSGATVIDGYDPNLPTVAVDAQLLKISVPADIYFAEESITPTIIVKNRGTDDITSFTAKYKINDDVYVVENWNGTLASGDSAEIIFPGIGITYGSHTFEALVTAPNTATDMSPLNDTLIKTFKVLEVIFNDDFETDKGWTMNGEWERDAPQGLGGDYGNPDPTIAYGGSIILGLDLTGQGIYPGDYEASLTSRAEYAISPVFDCSLYENIELLFQRWLNVESPTFDQVYIDITTDGSTWNELWANTGNIEESTWNFETIDISAYADKQAMVQIRFSIGETDESWQYSGWNLDDFTITGISTTPEVSLSSLPGCGLSSGSVTVSSNKSGIQTFYLRDDIGNPINDWTGDATSYDFIGLSDGVYKGQTEKDGLISELSSSKLLINDDILPIAPTLISESNSQICSGASSVLSYTGGDGVVFAWYTEVCGENLVGAGNDFRVFPINTTTYYGRWENACGFSTCENLIINVGTTTNIINQPIDVNASIEDDISFSVVAIGDNLLYQWRKDGLDIGGAETDNYFINNVQVSDEGNYDVIITGDCGIETGNVAVLSVASSVESISDFGTEIYPNPSNGTFNIVLSSDFSSAYISLTDISGKIIYEKSSLNKGVNVVNINNALSGIYFVHIYIDNKPIITKLIIK